MEEAERVPLSCKVKSALLDFLHIAIIQQEESNVHPHGDQPQSECKNRNTQHMVLSCKCSSGDELLAFSSCHYQFHWSEEEGGSLAERSNWVMRFVLLSPTVPLGGEGG